MKQNIKENFSFWLGRICLPVPKTLIIFSLFGLLPFTRRRVIYLQSYPSLTLKEEWLFKTRFLMDRTFKVWSFWPNASIMNLATDK